MITIYLSIFLLFYKFTENTIKMNVSDLLNKIFSKKKDHKIRTSSIIKPSIKDNYKKNKTTNISSLKMEIVKSEDPGKLNVGFADKVFY